jgi:hypothetical protein
MADQSYDDFFLGGGVSDPLCLSSFSALPFSDYSVYGDDRHLLAHAMASDFSVTWQTSYDDFRDGHCDQGSIYYTFLFCSKKRFVFTASDLPYENYSRKFR